MAQNYREMTKRVAERVFGVPFRPSRLTWLFMPSEGYLHDFHLFNEEMGLAIDTDGNPPEMKFSTAEEQRVFMLQKATLDRDRAVKARRCREQGVRLWTLYPAVHGFEKNAEDRIETWLRYHAPTLFSAGEKVDVW